LRSPRVALDRVRRRSARAAVRGIVDTFTWLYYRRVHSTWGNTRWLGTKVEKLPSDLWIYQEMLTELRPDLIIETGTMYGGSALYLASICDLLGHGQVVTIDIEDRSPYPAHPRVEYIQSSSTDPDLVARLRLRAERRTTLVILDSDHSRDHVLAELHAYAPLVSPGGYLIVEDTVVNGHPVLRSFGPGPMEAVNIFLSESRLFKADSSREKFLMTWNRKGFLRRVGDTRSRSALPSHTHPTRAVRRG
jgi:cephalosporin hydroxylase